jgi:hypothetical protein
MTPTDLTRLEELQNFLSGGASSRPTTQGLLPGGANDNGAVTESAAPTSGDEE